MTILRNKKTGEMINIHKVEIIVHYAQGRKTIHFKHLEDLDDWEEYEEDKIYWYIDEEGEIKSKEFGWFNLAQDKIGNRFETKEEAEKVVEKLKAWKRLKAQGFRFNGGDDACISYRIDPAKWNDKLDNDFDLLFGGEE